MSRDRADGHTFPTATDFSSTLIADDAAARAARLVTRRLGDQSQDALEALGLVGYVGGDRDRSRGNHRPIRRVWREGRAT